MALADSGQYVISVRMEELYDVQGLPVIRRNMTIYPDLHSRMHVAGTEVSVRKVIFYDTNFLLTCYLRVGPSVVHLKNLKA